MDSIISGTLSTAERKAISKRLEELEQEERHLKTTLTKTDFEITQKSYEQIDWVSLKQALFIFKEDAKLLSKEQLIRSLNHHLSKIILHADKVILIFKKLPWPIELSNHDILTDTS